MLLFSYFVGFVKGTNNNIVINIMKITKKRAFSVGFPGANKDLLVEEEEYYDCDI